MINMESANLHQQQQLQDQLVGSPSSSSSTPSYCYGVGVATSPAWTPTPNVTLNAGGDFSSPSYNGVILNSRQKNEISSVPPHPTNSMIQTPAGLHWTNNEGSFTNQFTHDDHNLGKIKKEFSESFPKFTELLNNPSSINQNSHLHPKLYVKCDDDHEKRDLNDLSEKLLLKTISSGFPINMNQFSAGEFYSHAHNISGFGNSIPSGGNFSQIYPSINISSLNQSSSATSSNSFDMNSQALDLLTSSRFSGNLIHPSHEHNLGMYKEGLPFGIDHMQQSSHRPQCTPTGKMSPPFTNGNETTEAKRPSGSMEPKATPKKSRVESRTSCPPFKVRKEKLGDRIAALQQLVAPFGKTDTASVLMEAIGYIKFLQNQVETLSVPYMKASRNKASRNSQGSSMTTESANEETKRDLRSRGLCLVPLSCMSYVTNDGGGGAFWPPPNYG